MNTNIEQHILERLDKIDTSLKEFRQEMNELRYVQEHQNDARDWLDILWLIAIPLAFLIYFLLILT